MSLSIVFPIGISDSGFESFSDSETKAAIQQNLKMLLLTRPGEYVMEPDFGVGMSNFLFDLETQNNEQRISSRIRQQVSKYMPYVSISSIQFNYENVDSNTLGVRLEYITSESQIIETFQLTVTL
jgi:phage baseplate assembly protein W